MMKCIKHSVTCWHPTKEAVSGGNRRWFLWLPSTDYHIIVGCDNSTQQNYNSIEMEISVLCFSGIFFSFTSCSVQDMSLKQKHVEMLITGARI